MEKYEYNKKRFENWYGPVEIGLDEIIDLAFLGVSPHLDQNV